MKQLVALVTVGDLGSVSAAARALHLVQPAVTRQVRSLETELGVRLFERSRAGMVPTAAGSIMIERAKRALAELERGQAMVSHHSAEMSGTVTVGLLESVAELVALPLRESVRQKYPKIEVRILSGYSGHLAQWAEDGDVDISMLYATGEAGLGLASPLVRESLWAVAGPDAGLSPDQPVGWDQICAHPLALPVPGHGLRALIDLGLAESGHTASVAIETNSMAIQKLAAREGRAWTVLPSVGVAADVADGRLSAAPVSNPEIVRMVAISLVRVRPSLMTEVVAGELVAAAGRLVRAGRWPGTFVGRPQTA